MLQAIPECVGSSSFYELLIMLLLGVLVPGPDVWKKTLEDRIRQRYDPREPRDRDGGPGAPPPSS